MPGERFAQWLRFGAVALFSIVLASCGSGSGEPSVDVSDEETAAAENRMVFADYFGDPPAGNAKTIAKAALPTGSWVVDTGYGSDNDGWGNDEWQQYTNSIDNVFTENGNLVLRAQCATAPTCGKRDGSITSGKVISKNRINVKFGTVRARIKMPDGGGMWPAFWMLGADIDERPWPDAGEIDIVEMFYYFSDNRTTHFTMHWAGPPRKDGLTDGCANPANIPIKAGEVHRCVTVSKEFEAEDGFPPLTADFHVYELDWTESRITGKIDGIQYFSRAIDGSTMEEFLKDYFMILNVAVGGTLGGQSGPWMTAAEWADPNKTDMLVDYVEVYERVPATKATLIDESGSNIRYNGILNSINSGGGLVEVNVKDTDVPALVGEQTMSIRFSNTFTGVPGSRPVEFSGAIFDFSGKDLSDFENFVFSLDSSRFPGFRDVSVEFTDRDGNKGKIRTGDYTPISVDGTWRTYAIPFAHFPGVDMSNIVGIGFFNPYGTSNNLLAGTLYFDEIRFTGSASCSALSSIEFDQVDYNPDTTIAAVYVNDLCAANRQVLVKAENESGEIYVPAKLDAAGNGRAIINLGKSDSAECVANDTTSVLRLTTGLMASYNRPMGAKGPANSSFAAAGVDPGAPISTITGATDYILASTEETSFEPESDFKFSDFGTGSSFNGDFRGDATFSPVFAISNGANSFAQMALFEFIPGFTRSVGTIDMKVKNLPGNNITVKFGSTTGATTESTYTVNVTTAPESTPLGNDWYLVSIPMTNFPNADAYNYVVFASDASATPPNWLITDIALQERIGNLPADCGIPPVPPVTGSGTGATGATGGPYSISFDDMAVAYSFVGFGNPDTVNVTVPDPLDAANTVVQTTKLTGSQVWAGVTVETVPGISWPLSVAESEITLRIYSPGPGVTVRMKLEDSTDNTKFVEIDAVTTVTTGWETLTFDFGAPPAFTTDKLSLFFDFGNPGVGTVFTWDTIEFQGTGMTGGNLATNGDFETGPDHLTGWTPSPGSGATEAVDTEDSGSTWAGRIFSPMGNGSALSQANLAAGTVQPGDMIDVAFDLCGSLSGVSGEFRPAVLSEFGMGAGATRQDLQNFTMLPDVWTRYNYQAIAGADVTGGVSLQFDAICGAVAGCEVEAFIDNVSITIGGGIVPGTASGMSCAAGGGGGGGTGGSLDSYIYATDSGITPDLMPSATEEFGSGSAFDTAYALDADFNPAFQVSSGTGYGVNVGFVAFNGFAAGFAKDFATLHFKVKGLPTDSTEGQPANSIEVKFINGGDTSVIYEFDTYSGATDIGNGWYDVEIPLDDFAGTIDANSGLLLGPKGAWGAPFSFLLTDIGFSGTSTGGGGGGGGSAMGVLNTNGDFETGDFTGVETFPNAGTIAISSVNPRAGAFAANLDVPNPGGDALIKFANLSPGGFTAGQTIYIKFYMRGSLTVGGVGFAEFFSELSGGGVSKAEILFGNAPVFPNADPSVWTLFETTTTTGTDSSGGVTLQLKAGSGGGSANLFFDDVCVSTEPCP